MGQCREGDFPEVSGSSLLYLLQEEAARGGGRRAALPAQVRWGEVSWGAPRPSQPPAFSSMLLLPSLPPFHRKEPPNNWGGGWVLLGHRSQGRGPELVTLS